MLVVHAFSGNVKLLSIKGGDSLATNRCISTHNPSSGALVEINGREGVDASSARAFNGKIINKVCAGAKGNGIRIAPGGLKGKLLKKEKERKI